jgi:hypothetical protein
MRPLGIFAHREHNYAERAILALLRSIAVLAFLQPRRQGRPHRAAKTLLLAFLPLDRAFVPLAGFDQLRDVLVQRLGGLKQKLKPFVDGHSLGTIVP